MSSRPPDQEFGFRPTQGTWAELLRKADEAFAAGDRDTCIAVIEVLLKTFDHGAADASSD